MSAVGSLLMDRFFRRPAAASIPAGLRAYVVGDIHGRLDLLDRLLAIVAEDSADCALETRLVFVGDYVDRGSHSMQVIERLLELPPQTCFLRGNHDQAVLDFLSDAAFYRTWKNYGAQETLLSYGVRPPRFDDAQEIAEVRDRFAQNLPASHVKFLQDLELFVEIGDYFIVHAGVRPGIDLKAQNAADMLWIRDDFLFSNRNFGKVVVHGHTPTDTPVSRENRIGIDTGAYATGRLTALVLEKSSRRFLHT